MNLNKNIPPDIIDKNDSDSLNSEIKYINNIKKFERYDKYKSVIKIFGKNPEKAKTIGKCNKSYQNLFKSSNKMSENNNNMNQSKDNTEGEIVTESYTCNNMDQETMENEENVKSQNESASLRSVTVAKKVVTKYVSNRSENFSFGIDDLKTSAGKYLSNAKSFVIDTADNSLIFCGKWAGTSKSFYKAEVAKKI